MSNWGEAFIPQIIDEQPIIDPVHAAGGTQGGSGYVWCGKKAMPLNGFCSEGVCGNTHDGEGGQHEGNE